MLEAPKNGHKIPQIGTKISITRPIGSEMFFFQGDKAIWRKWKEIPTYTSWWKVAKVEPDAIEKNTITLEYTRGDPYVSTSGEKIECKPGDEVDFHLSGIIYLADTQKQEIESSTDAK
jgi:hypothetical protein